MPDGLIERKVMFKRIGSCFFFHRMIKSFMILAIAIIIIAEGSYPAEAGDRPSGFSFGFRERVRQSYLKNGFDLDENGADDWNYVRVRSQLWGSWEHSCGWKVFAQINNEHRHWFKSTRGYENEDFEIDELVIENLYFSADRIAGSPISVTLGRQNISYGEGFLMMDGGPLDGSRTRYFNALRLKAEMKSRYFEVHMLSNPSRDRYLPVVNSLRRNLIEKDERGAGVYYVDNSFGDYRVEGYYFYKAEEMREESWDDIHTLGARMSGSYGGGGSYAAEFSFQFGKRLDADRNAMGGYAHSEYRLGVLMKPAVRVGLIYLSGDDPNTEEFEGWNPLYSRWPKWSDLYIYNLASMGRGVAYWENLASADIGISVNPVDNIGLDASLFYMTAPQEPVIDSSDPSPAVIGGSDRGMLSIVRLNWSYTDYISGHLLWERFYPGNYYFDNADPADFLRCQIYISY